MFPYRKKKYEGCALKSTFIWGHYSPFVFSVTESVILTQSHYAADIVSYLTTFKTLRVVLGKPLCFPAGETAILRNTDWQDLRC